MAEGCSLDRARSAPDFRWGSLCRVSRATAPGEVDREAVGERVFDADADVHHDHSFARDTRRDPCRLFRPLRPSAGSHEAISVWSPWTNMP